MKVWFHVYLAAGLLWAGCSKSAEEKSKEPGKDQENPPAPPTTNAAPDLPPEKQHVVKLMSAAGQPGFSKHPVLQMFEYQNALVAFRIAFKTDPFNQPNVTEAIAKEFDHCTLTLKFPGRAGEGMVSEARLEGFLRISGEGKDFANFKGLKLSFADHRLGRLGGKLEGTVTEISERPKEAIGTVADAEDPRATVHRINLPFVVDFDLALAGKGPNPPPVKAKLSPAAVAAALGAQVGQWSVKGQSTPTGGEPSTYALVMDIHWKEEGKSIVTSCTLMQDGKQIKLTGQKSYDSKLGVFVYRQTAAGMPEMISHERYHEATRTFHGITVAPQLPPGMRVSYTHQIDSKNLIRFKSTRFQGARLIHTEEQTYTRRDAETTKPKTP